MVRLSTRVVKLSTYKQVFDAIALEDKPLASGAVDIFPLFPVLRWYMLSKSTEVMDSGRFDVAKIGDIIYMACRKVC